jgi:hypothetical protein
MPVSVPVKQVVEVPTNEFRGCSAQQALGCAVDRDDETVVVDYHSGRLEVCQGSVEQGARVCLMPGWGNPLPAGSGDVLHVFSSVRAESGRLPRSEPDMHRRSVALPQIFEQVFMGDESGRESRAGHDA